MVKRCRFDVMALALIPLRAGSRLDIAPYYFLDSLALAWRRHRDEGSYDCVGTEIHFIHSHGRSLVESSVDTASISKAVDGEGFPNHSQNLRHPIFAAAACGNYEYVLWELERDPSNIPLFTPLRLMHCILTNRGNIEPTAEQQLLNVIDALHTHYGLSPNTVYNLSNTGFYPASRDVTGSISIDDEAVAQLRHKTSLWQYILLLCFMSIKFGHDFTRRHVSQHVLAHIIEKFLEHGADPHFYISVKRYPGHSRRLVTRVQGERREQWFRFYHFRSGMEGFECENMSLVDLFESSSVKNKLRILELIKINTSNIEIAIAEENMMLLKELTPHPWNGGTRESGRC
jgi:hypothetical protein